jgi:hypothetical protein
MSFKMLAHWCPLQQLCNCAPLSQPELRSSSGSATAYATTSATTFGNTGYAATNVIVNGSSFSTPIYRPTSSVGVTVIMFHAEEPGAQGAFDAAQVLKQMNG